MESFRFQELTVFQGKAAAVKKPREITEFSFDDQHVCHPLDNSSLRFYYPPWFDVPHVERPVIHLSRGFDSFVHYDDDRQLGLKPLLDTIQAHEERTRTKVTADFVTWRGLLTKILVAPFDKYSEFKMNATCIEGTIYIKEYVPAKTEQDYDRAVRTDRMSRTWHRPGPDEMTFWGYKFETISTLPKPWAECTRAQIDDREDEIVNNNSQYVSVVRTGIDGHSIVIAGEVDAIAGSKPDDPNEQIPYVELKTSQNFHYTDDYAEQKCAKYHHWLPE